jgi:hypothetical protein
MIKYVPSFLTNEETEYFINIFKNGVKQYFGDQYYKFYFVDLMDVEIEVRKLDRFVFKKFRVQMVNETIQQIEEPHTHLNSWSFIVFLNDNFDGGEIFFGDKEYKPKKGDMIYFSGEEYHMVNNCVGNRYTLIGFMLNNPFGIQIQKDLI